MKKLINWHKKIIKEVQDKIGLSDYQIYWLAFLEGVAVALLIIWLIN